MVGITYEGNERRRYANTYNSDNGVEERINMDKHVQVIGILWIVLGAMSFLGGLFLCGTLIGISLIPEMEAEASSILRIVGMSFGIFLWILSAPKIICGIGLLRKMEWARILTIVLSFLSLLNIPFGTALGIYSLVILLRDETVQLFKPQ